MNKSLHLCYLLLASLLLLPITSFADTKTGEFNTINWVDLLPQSDLDALMNPPSYLDEIVDGSEEDTIENAFEKALSLGEDNAYQQALVSTRVVPEMDQKPIRLPGFIVPLAFNETQQITSFFLVPYFGACIHLPPPPPNQIVYIDYPEGLAVDDIYQAFWLSGILHTDLVENDLASSAYSLTLKKLEVYEDEPE